MPDDISFETAAAMMLQGLTVEYLFHRICHVRKGDTVLFHAAAGGVGLIACQWARSEGITLIGTAGSDAKCALALEHGATHCINYKTGDFAAGIRELTGGRGVDVVMDGVGADTFQGSLNSIRPLGWMISFGNASGPVPPFAISELSVKGSIKLTRPTLFHFMATREDSQKMADHLFEKLQGGAIKPNIGQRFKLDDIRAAHEALEARKTTGSTLVDI